MKHLFFQLNKLRRLLKDNFIFLFLDYDGTLAPIVQSPVKAIMPQKTRDILRRLSENPHCRVAIISGRALKDIKNRIGLDGAIYAGNHGLEIRGPKIKFKAPLTMGYMIRLRKIKGLLKNRLSKIKGVIVEDKGLTLSVHYRLVDAKDARLVKTIFHETLACYIASNEIKIRPGKRVLEIRPPSGWNKGDIVLWLLARRKLILNKEPCIPIYIGDDLTDEDAFKALRDKGLTIFVGGFERSSAEYYLRNTDEVTGFLEEILKVKKDNSACQD